MRTALMAGAALCAALGVGPATAQAKPAAPSVPGFEIAEIKNTGSTNTTGYRIIVPLVGRYYGTASYYITSGAVSTGQMVTGTLPPGLAKKFAHDLHAATPLDTLPVTMQMKSVSFGTSIYITYQGQRTPDLSAPADPRGQALKADITAIAAALNLKNGPRRPVMLLTPPVPRH